jgi:hypothetical protein
MFKWDSLFLKLECAFYYSLQKIQNGEYLRWYANGKTIRGLRFFYKSSL